MNLDLISILAKILHMIADLSLDELYKVYQRDVYPLALSL